MDADVPAQEKAGSTPAAATKAAEPQREEEGENMKGAALKKFCKKAKTPYLTSHNGRQWISARSAAYPLDGYPKMDSESMLPVLEISEDKRAGYAVMVEPRPNDTLARLMGDMTDGECVSARLAGITISVAEAGSYKPVETPNGLRFIEEEALRPLADVLDRCVLVYREESKVEAIVVMLGMMTVGVLMCVKGWADERTMHEVAAAARALAEESGRGSGQGEQMRMEDAR